MNDAVNAEQYAEFVASRAKPGGQILATLNAHHCDLLHAVLGMAGEVGEVTDLVKKAVMYGQPIPVAEIEKELGDIEFYTQMLRSALEISRNSVLVVNVAKLTQRYPEGYSDADAVNRVDQS